jgi:hypothetical protein
MSSGEKFRPKIRIFTARPSTGLSALLYPNVKVEYQSAYLNLKDQAFFVVDVQKSQAPFFIDVGPLLGFAQVCKLTVLNGKIVSTMFAQKLLSAAYLTCL